MGTCIVGRARYESHIHPGGLNSIAVRFGVFTTVSFLYYKVLVIRFMNGTDYSGIIITVCGSIDYLFSSFLCWDASEVCKYDFLVQLMHAIRSLIYVNIIALRITMSGEDGENGGSIIQFGCRRRVLISYFTILWHGARLFPNLDFN